ncbi:MAG: alpha/beta fold hydrolase, partial [Nocardioides sp.]|nr:alpha/beta fold hydrolase [Nocardioides sp.]
MFISPRAAVRRLVHMPSVSIPEGRLIELPGRDGATFVTDTAGPRPDSPTILLLHAVGTTGLLTWYPSIPELATRYRVVTLDQRWHGQGIASDSFSLRDCADDAAALIGVLALENVVPAGYSMGSIVAQRLWRQHPERVSGLVLCATTDRFRSTVTERVFHEAMEWSMAGLRGTARSGTASAAARAAARALDLEMSDIHDWALAEFRSTSPWAVGQAVGGRGRPAARVSALTPVSQRLLQGLGVWPRVVERRATPYSGMQVWDAAGSGAVNFSADQAGLAVLGHIVEND